MGFFKKEKCVVCNKNLGILGHYYIADKQAICSQCLDKAGLETTLDSLLKIEKMTTEDVKAAMKQEEIRNEEVNSFCATKKIGDYIQFDDNQKKWLILSAALDKKSKSKVYKYSDIVNFELLEDGETITKGGIGSAVVGGTLFGGVGAIVGGITGGKKTKPVCNNLKIKITIDNIENPAVYINLITIPTRKNRSTYKKAYDLAHECLSVLQLICNNKETLKQENTPSTEISSADEILKYKKLLDEEIITQEEFDAKKKQLLNI
ncbi:SHOCT domain-containing protein [Clostridium thailandense]|uniref:SHOCT domain-containing protein n=1 Tax=Clostridium thailandense TaxID=2794346 RepID=UPI003988AF72